MSYDPSSVEQRFDSRRDPVPLLDALQRLVLERVPSALDRALGRVDDYLFDRSKSGNDDLGLTALRDLRRVRAQIAQRFEEALIAGFRRLRDPRKGAGVLGELFGLSLLSEDALEEQLANEQLAESLSRMHAPSLELLGQRMAHILAPEEFKASENPLTPTFLAAALRKAAEAAELGAGIRIVLFKLFERELAGALAHVYDRSNTLLVAAGVLPQLRATSKAEAMPSPVPTSGEPGQPGGAGLGGGSGQGGFQNMQPSPAEQAMFGNLLGLLQGWRTAMGPIGPMGGQAGIGPAVTLGSNELVSILSLMQRDLSAQLQFAKSQQEHPLAVQIRQEVVQGARKLGVESDNLQLDGLDEDAVDLVAMLFDVLLDGPQYDTDVRRKIGRMLVPYVKVAVKDRRMFMLKEHPARRLLNTVAEACEGNHGEAPQERELLGRVDNTIDRLVAEFNEDVAIFETLEQELRAYLAQSRKRVELAEKRATEAQHGRERLDHARSAVNAALAQHRGERQLPAVIDSFINHYAAHHLIQVMLRDGHGSPRFEESMLAVADLLLAFDHAELRTPIAELPALPRKALLEILSSSGCTGDLAEQALASLRDAMVRLAQGERATEITNRMPELVIPPDPAAIPAPDQVALQLIAGTDTLDFDASVLGRMRKLKVGDWIQLETGAERVEPAKVSWISPISGRLLLVNRRGIRVLVAAPEELAAMAKLGKAILREGDTMFDDAMHQVVDRLKAASRGPAAG